MLPLSPHGLSDTLHGSSEGTQSLTGYAISAASEIAAQDRSDEDESMKSRRSRCGKLLANPRGATSTDEHHPIVQPGPQWCAL